MAQRESTTVAIVGGGVSGLTTAMLLRQSGIDSVVLERQTRDYVERRQRAGLVEYRGVRMFREWGLERLLGTHPANNTLEVRVDGEACYLGRDEHSQEAVGQLVPQQALVRALIAEFLAGGGDLRFEAADVSLAGIETSRPVVRYTDSGNTAHEIECDFVAGCDGDHGVTNACVPAGAGAEYAHDFDITWLTILAEAPPPENPLIAVGKRGYAAHFARGPSSSRFYLQIPADDTPANWPAARIWDQLRRRLHRPALPGGEITETEVFPLRALVREPMTHGRLYLIGDAAHVISPMGAKGMNLALFDAETFVTAVGDFARDGDDAGLRAYSATCLARTWKYQEWSHWMADMLCGLCPENATPFRRRLARARLDRVLNTPAGRAYWAELHTGLG